MDRSKIKELIIEHKERFLAKKNLVRRQVQSEIKNYITQREVVLVTGIRRSGKSSLLKLICDDLINEFNISVGSIMYINFEDERLIDFTVKDFDLLYETFIEVENPAGKKYLFLDEIQNVVKWERWVNRLFEFEDVKIFITGSNSKLLSSEISSVLTGRNRKVTNYPFSFSEFIEFSGLKLNSSSFLNREVRASLKRSLVEYIEFGGFPEVVTNRDVTLLEQYFKDIIYRDVIARQSIRNVREIREMALFLASNLGTLQSYKNIQQMINAKNVTTVKNHLEALESVYLFFFIDLFDYSIKKQIYNPSKVYSIDVALSNAISFRFSHNIGHIYENLVFLELLKRNKEVYYWKSSNGKEVDFVVKKGHGIDQAIQVCLYLSDKRTKDREMAALKDAFTELRTSDLMIITEDEEEEIVSEGITIRVVPLWKWLLKDRSPILSEISGILKGGKL